MMLCMFLSGSSTYAAQASASPRAYALSPERTAQAIAHARAAHQLYFFHFAYSIVLLLLALRFRLAPRFRDWAERAASSRFWQALVFVLACRLSLDALSLPADVADHWLQLQFGQYLQGWGSWLWDETKGDLVSAVAEVLLIWALYEVIRRSTRRWWIYVWLGTLPLIVYSVCLNPLVIDPLFFHFSPLAVSQPELAKQIERLVVRSGQQIPESRIFLMDASRKLNELNANVTGLGASKRVVVWDTIVARMSQPEILIVFGHEMGHYILGHIPLEMLFAAGQLLVALRVGYYAFRWLVRRYGDAWALRGPDDWASLPVLLLLELIFAVVCTPVSHAYVRNLEQEADQYALEVVHGIVPDAPAVAAEAFQILGEVNLEEPSPSWLVKVWFYDHPPVGDRIRFAYSYDPWAEGRSPRFVK